MFKIEVAYQLSNVIEKDSHTKVVNKIAFHLFSKILYHPYVCVDGIIKIIEHYSMF